MKQVGSILDPSAIDCLQIIADQEAIRRAVPQRLEMELLTAIVYSDSERRICAAYKDVTRDDFWARGHMPGYPLMPGVLQCEAAAQLSTYFAVTQQLTGGQPIIFAALDEVRFRAPVIPPARLLVVMQATRVRAQVCISRFECFVNGVMVSDGVLKGVAMAINAENLSRPAN
jgi:3-hydroxyacyl-[acyl-carrier-protein] dehydratase